MTSGAPGVRTAPPAPPINSFKSSTTGKLNKVGPMCNSALVLITVKSLDSLSDHFDLSSKLTENNFISNIISNTITILLQFPRYFIMT